jgi:CheY-like chemotaxis protein
VLRITGDNIHSPPQMISSRISGEYIQSIGILGSRVVIIVDLAKVMTDSDIRAVSEHLENQQNSQSSSLKNILIVEDSTLMRSTLKSFIPKNFSVMEAPDGEQALVLFKKDADKIGLVLLDIKLPGMNGVDVLKELLRLKPGLNIVMETSVYDDTTKETCLKFGAKDYLKKPISKRQIEEVIAKYSS